MRFKTRLEVHAHLVKQRFLPRDMHSPERKDAIVRALSDPAGFSEPFALASMPIDAPEPEEAQRYEALIDALDGRRVPLPSDLPLPHRAFRSRTGCVSSSSNETARGS